MAKSNVSFQGALRGLNEARVIASGADKDGSIREGFGPGLLAASMFSVAFCHPGLDELKTLGGICCGCYLSRCANGRPERGCSYSGS